MKNPNPPNPLIVAALWVLLALLVAAWVIWRCG